MIVAGFGLGLSNQLTLSWIAGNSPPGLRGTALGMRMTANRIGQLSLPATVGLAAGATGITPYSSARPRCLPAAPSPS